MGKVKRPAQRRCAGGYAEDPCKCRFPIRVGFMTEDGSVPGTLSAASYTVQAAQTARRQTTCAPPYPRRTHPMLICASKAADDIKPTRRGPRRRRAHGRE